jgi:hypothetical protein
MGEPTPPPSGCDTWQVCVPRGDGRAHRRRLSLLRHGGERPTRLRRRHLHRNVRATPTQDRTHAATLACSHTRTPPYTRSHTHSLAHAVVCVGAASDLLEANNQAMQTAIHTELGGSFGSGRACTDRTQHRPCVVAGCARVSALGGSSHTLITRALGATGTATATAASRARADRWHPSSARRCTAVAHPSIRCVHSTWKHTWTVAAPSRSRSRRRDGA